VERVNFDVTFDENEEEEKKNLFPAVNYFGDLFKKGGDEKRHDVTPSWLKNVWKTELFTFVLMKPDSFLKE